MATAVNRRTLIGLGIVAPIGVLAGLSRANASGPLSISLTKTKIGAIYRVRVYATVNTGVAQLLNQYMGYLDVPSTGSVTKTLSKVSGAINLVLQVTMSRLSQSTQIIAKVQAKLNGANMAVIENMV